MANVTENGVDLFFETTGSGERVVLMHGSWTNGTSWAAVSVVLVASFSEATLVEWVSTDRLIPIRDLTPVKGS